MNEVYDAAFRKLVTFSALVTVGSLLVHGCERQFEPKEEEAAVPSFETATVQLPGVGYELYYYDNATMGGWDHLYLSTGLDTLRFALGKAVSFWVRATSGGVPQVETMASTLRMGEPIDCTPRAKHDGAPLCILYDPADSTSVFPQAVRIESQPGYTSFARIPYSGFLRFRAWSQTLGDYLAPSPPIWIEIESAGRNGLGGPKGPNVREG